jgi:hypothetical protein
MSTVNCTRVLSAAAIVMLCSAPLHAASDCSFWGFACASLAAPSREEAVAMMSDFTAYDAWQIGNGTPIFTEPAPVTLWGASTLTPDVWGNQAGLLDRINARHFPLDRYSQPGPFPMLHHWWILSSPTHGDFSGYESHGAYRINPDRITALVVGSNKFSVFAGGLNRWNLYYYSKSGAIVPEPSVVGLLLFAPILMVRRWR